MRVNSHSPILEMSLKEVSTWQVSAKAEGGEADGCYPNSGGLRRAPF